MGPSPRGSRPPLQRVRGAGAQGAVAPIGPPAPDALPWRLRQHPAQPCRRLLPRATPSAAAQGVSGRGHSPWRSLRRPWRGRHCPCVPSSPPPPSLWEQDWAPQVGAVGSACPQPSACTLAVPHAGEGCPPHTGRVGRAEASVPLPTAAARRPWTGCSRPWGPGARPGSAPPASASRSRRCCAPASAPSTRRGGRPGTTSTARSPRRPSPSVSGAACPPDRSAGGVGRGQGGWWRS